MKAIITGITGFVGKNMGEFLREKEYEVIALVRDGSPKNQDIPSEITQIVTDFADPERLYNDLMTSEVDVMGAELYHCGAILSARQAKRSAYERVNVESSMQLAKFAVEKEISKFIFVSTMGAAGPVGSFEKPMDESYTWKPGSIYSKSKLKAENQLKEYLNGKVPLSIFRPPNIYGEDMAMRSGSAVIFKSLRKSYFPMVGKADNYVNMVYIGNLVEAMYTCTLNMKSGYELFFISDGNPYAMRKFIEVVKTEWGSKTKIIPIPKYFVFPFAKLIDWLSSLIGRNIGFNMEIYDGLTTNKFIFTTEKAKKFGYVPKFNLEEAVKRTRLYVESQI